MAAAVVLDPSQEMYKMKRVYPESSMIELPDRMYHMKNLHSSESKEPMTPEMEALEDRQLQILNELEALRNEVKQLSNSLGHKFGESLPETAVKSLVAVSNVLKLKQVQLPSGIVDFVISVSPKQQALSAVLIAEILQANDVNIALNTHLHSSLKEDIPKHLLQVTGGLTGRIRVNVDQLVFTFIWKDDPFSPSLMYSSRNQTKIHGDVNIARYLCRMLVPDLYDETNPASVAVIDKWLENARQLMHGGSREKDSAMKSLNSHLGQNDYLSCGHLTVADITSLSALLANKDSFKTLPKNVKKWFVTILSSFKSTIDKLDVPDSWKS